MGLLARDIHSGNCQKSIGKEGVDCFSFSWILLPLKQEGGGGRKRQNLQDYSIISKCSRGHYFQALLINGNDPKKSLKKKKGQYPETIYAVLPVINVLGRLHTFSYLKLKTIQYYYPVS